MNLQRVITQLCNSSTAAVPRHREWILPAAKDMWPELLGESAANKMAQDPLSATTISRRIDKIAGDVEAQL